MQVYNTLTKTKEELKPLDFPKVGIYTCGPTVYHYAHIGNLRSYVFSDLLKRSLTFLNFEVKHVMNITDVGHLTDDADEGEDKMEKGAARTGKSVWEVAEFYTQAFKKDLKALNIIEPEWCKATDNIPEQIEQIKQLEAAGVTYETSDGIYFDTSKIGDYGKLANLQTENLEGGKRVDLGEKKNKTDFALWKFSPKNEKRQMEWESPWGLGFPGWHIECSAMATKYLGKQIDIHTGGIDHIPVHHTNEIAQAETALDSRPWVKYWMHGEFLVLDKGEKMAKSEDNFLTLKSLKEKGYSAMEYRYLLLTGHYRQQLKFSWEALDGAKASYERIKNIVSEMQGEGEVNDDYQGRFEEAIEDDLNAPQALAVLWDLLRDKEVKDADKRTTVEKFDEVLGLSLVEEQVTIPEDIKALADKRQEKRESKEWDEADRMREELKEKGWEVRDSKEGHTLKKIEK